MKFNTQEQQLRQLLEQIDTPKVDNLHEKVHQRLTQKSPFSKGLKMTLATCLCLFLALPVAASTPTFQKLVYLISSEMIDALQPINLVSEDNDIRLEVLGALNDEEQVVIYLTLQDSNGDILDETLDIYNYTLDGVSILNIQTIDYNKETKTATLRLQGNGGKHLNGKSIRFGIQSFLTNKKFYDNMDVLLDWNELLSTTPEIITLGEHDSSGGSGLITVNDTAIQVLKPNQMDIKIPGLDFVTITNVGYVNNRLHIQTRWLEDNIDDHGYFYFTDSSNRRVNNKSWSISYGVNENNETEYGRIMTEYIFEISPEELSTFNLHGDFVSNDTYTEGNWNVKFKLDSTTEMFTQKTDIKQGSTTVAEVKISPLGITLNIVGELIPEDWQVSLILKDGARKTLSSRTSMTIQDETTLKFSDPTLLKLENIEAIQINDTIIPLPE